MHLSAWCEKTWQLLLLDCWQRLMTHSLLLQFLIHCECLLAHRTWVTMFLLVLRVPGGHIVETVHWCFAFLDCFHLLHHLIECFDLTSRERKTCLRLAQKIMLWQQLHCLCSKWWKGSGNDFLKQKLPMKFLHSHWHELLYNCNYDTRVFTLLTTVHVVKMQKDIALLSVSF